MAAADFRADRPVVLIGPMGAGKSTVGRRLAKRLGLPFVDVDAEVEQTADLSVAEIFDRYGEAAFREREREVIARLAAGPPLVIAAGGGAVDDAASRGRLLECCTLVWLDADAPTLARRVGSDARDRPLLRGRDPAAVLAELIERRRPLYAAAHRRVDAEGSVETVVERVLAALAGRR